MRLSKKRYLSFITCGLLLALPIFLAFDVKAQTTRRTTRATPTPTPATALPIIISRADDFPDDDDLLRLGDIPGREPAERPTAKTEIKPAPQTSAPVDEDAKKEAAQRRLLLNIEILSKAEDRADNLRKQQFTLIEKEGELQAKLAAIDFDLRPEEIERTVAFAGTLRPEDLRDTRRRNLNAEKANIERLMSEIVRSKALLETNIQRADALVERLRQRLEKEIEDSFNEN